MINHNVIKEFSPSLFNHMLDVIAQLIYQQNQNARNFIFHHHYYSPHSPILNQPSKSTGIDNFAMGDGHIMV